MALKLTYPKLEDIPKDHVPFYVKQDDGSYSLDAEIDDSETKKKLKSFRENNISYKKQIDELQAKIAQFKDIDPEKAKKALAALEKLENDQDADALKAGKVDEVFAKRTEALRKDYDKQIQKLTEENKTLLQDRDRFKVGYSQLTLKDKLLSAVSNVGSLRKGAAADVLRRAADTWRLNEDGDLVALDADGEPVMGKKGDSPLTLEEYATSLVQESPYFFEPGAGSGAGGTKKPGDGQGGKGKLVIDGTDAVAMGRHSKEIASGEAVVRWNPNG